MTTEYHYHRSIAIRKNVDVFIAGGGPAGIAAAVSAASMGADVFLVESQGCLGGMGTSGLMPFFCRFGDGVNFLSGGIGRRVYDRMFELGGNGPDDAKNVWKELCINVEVLKRLYDEMAQNAGVKLSYFTTVVDVIRENNDISAVICGGKSGLFAVHAKIYIDCTGDGDIAAWAGADIEKGDAQGRMQPATLCSAWANVDWDTASRYDKVYVRAQLQKAFREDTIFTLKDPVHPGMWKQSATIAGGNIGHVFGVDSTDEQSLTSAMIEARRSMLEYQRFYQKYVPGFEACTLTATGALLGVRESRRVMGDYVINIEDFHKRAVFDDEIGRYCYSVDLHPCTLDPADVDQFQKRWSAASHHYEKGESYGIPYRILTPRKFDNLLVAGRCVSADRPMHGSLRVMPGCFITGQAAGVAAAMAAENNSTTREIEIKQLQRRLIELGAYLPNYKH